MARKFVNFQTEGKIALVTIDRPPVNALNQQVQREIEDAFDELQGRNDVGAVIIPGGGSKCFIAGADIDMISEFGYEEAFSLGSEMHTVLNMIEAFDRVVIAAINGLALGGGCEVALACDIRVADETAKLGLPEVSLGLMPGAGGTQRLPRLVGKGKAKELILTGDPIDANEARSIGLIERVVSKGQAVQEAMKIAERILLRGPVAIAKAKQAINEGMDMSQQKGLEKELQFFCGLFETRDMKEGTLAFKEKRKPNYIGK